MVVVKVADIATVVALSQQIPSFHQPYEAAEYERRLQDVPHLILVAYEGEKAVGFKVGYEREQGSFYSWMGGVLPAYRRRGIARQLALAQEAWATQQAYPFITFKTLNRHRAMLYFALSNGFNIMAVDSRSEIEEYRIWLRKELVPSTNCSQDNTD